MGSKQINFFATKGDILSFVKEIDSTRSLQYFESGNFDSPDITAMHSLATYPNLGEMQFGDNNSSPGVLVLRPEDPINVEPFQRTKGGILYLVYQGMNPKSISFRPGGSFGTNCVISGSMATISDDPVSIELYNFFRKEIKRKFLKIREYYVGDEAVQLLDSGGRLTQNVSAPAMCDLKRP